MSRTPPAIAAPLLLALALAACGGGSDEPAAGDVAICDASLDMDDALAADVPDEDLLLGAMSDADLASEDAENEDLIALAQEAGTLALTAEAEIADLGEFSDDLFDEMVGVADELSATCADLEL